MRRQRDDNVILSPGKPSRPKRGWFPFGSKKNDREPDTLTVGPYQVGIVIWDGTVLDVFSGSTQPLPKGEVQTYVASTAPFNLAFWLRVPWESIEPNDLVLDPPLVTADGEHVTGRIDLNFSVTTKGVDGTLVTSGDSSEGAHRLLQLLGLYGEIITKSDVSDMIKSEMLPKLLALDLNEYKADELRNNMSLLREFTRSLETELSQSIDRFGLQLLDFHLNWDIRDRQQQPQTGPHLSSVEIEERRYSASTPVTKGAWVADNTSTPLHQAAWDGQPEKALALISAGADIHARNKDGYTPLHLTAWSDQAETALALVSAGADIHARSESGLTPLHMAGEPETALTLISAGAKIDARDDTRFTPLHLAATGGHTETALALVSAGADLHDRDDGGFTPLHMAAGSGRSETALALVSAGADIRARGDGGITPPHMAAGFGRSETALALVSAGADIHARDDSGNTPLHYAAFQGQIEAIHALVSAGADVHARNDFGSTPLHTATFRGQEESALVLISLGADV